MGNVYTGEPVVPASGRFAYASLWMVELPPDFDLNHARVTIDGAPATPCYVGVSAADGLCQLNVHLPDGVRTGLVPVELAWLDKPLCPVEWLRVIPTGPAVPRVCSVTDGTNLIAGPRIETGLVKLVVEDLANAETVTATVDGRPVSEIEPFSTDALTGRFELNFRRPAAFCMGPVDSLVLAEILSLVGVAFSMGLRQTPKSAIGMRQSQVANVFTRESSRRVALKL